MSAIIISLTPEAQQIAQRYREMPAKILPAIARGMDKGAELMLGQILRTRFTGKGPFPSSLKRLGVVTNRLRSSLRRTAARIDRNGVTASIGSNVEYFGIHEFGFSGTVSVKGHQRKSPLSDRFSFGGGTVSRVGARRAGLVDRGGQKKDRAEQVSSGFSRVKPHSRKMNVPAREPLQTGIREHAGILQREILREVKALTGGRG